MKKLAGTHHLRAQRRAPPKGAETMDAKNYFPADGTGFSTRAAG